MCGSILLNKERKFVIIVTHNLKSSSSLYSSDSTISYTVVQIDDCSDR